MMMVMPYFLAIGLSIIALISVPNLIRALCHPLWPELQAEITSSTTHKSADWSTKEGRTTSQLQWVRVSYAFNGRDYSTTLPNGFGLFNSAPGDRIAIRVCPRRPTLIWATFEGGFRPGSYIGGAIIHIITVGGCLVAAYGSWQLWH